MEELGRRAIECESWRWMPGMKRLDGDIRLVGFSSAQAMWCRAGAHVYKAPLWDGERGLPSGDPLAIPDLSDPATLGCLLALVREAYGPEFVEVGMTNAWWYVEVACWDFNYANTSSFAEALVAALEAAP